jgi:crotonobetainyl-CoA:carnitine CoA-transferase CaiB-like acyl-CoA transferase
MRADARAQDALEVHDAGAWLGGPLAVDDLAVAATATALLAAAELAQARGAARPTVWLSAEHVALSFTSERHALVGGRPAGAGFAPLSRLVRCLHGGWARTHANYPHHAAALERALAIDLAGRPDAVAALEHAAGRLGAVTLEDAVFAAGGCATALRSVDEWAGHPAGRAAAGAPLVAWQEGLATRCPRPLGHCARASRPAEGVRVLDLTRVIAGPVAGRTLAALGAEVLRVDPPSLPELPQQHLDTGAGKRTAVLDLADSPTREALLADADVVLMGYRPGALARLGLREEELAERHPHLVQVSLSAWGADGPWAQRRGFDSLVQVACGIAALCADADGAPGVLPAQALDHATGHLMAGAALRALAGRARGETVSPARLSLAATAAALLRAPRPLQAAGDLTGRADPSRHRVAFGDVALIAPPGMLDGDPLGWRHGPRPLGGDPPAWTPRLGSQ